jgi:hypothetical protein
VIAATIALMLVSLPHALEDIRYREFERFGLAPQAAIVLLMAAYALQAIGIALVLARPGRLGVGLLATMGAVWCLGALAVHGPELLFAGPGYRHGLISKALEVAIIVLGAFVACLGWRALALFAILKRSAG